MMSDIGVLTEKQEEAEIVISSIQSNFKNLKQINKKVLYLIWKAPYMAAGQNTFINHLLGKCGLENSVLEKTSRYIELTKEQISLMDLDYIFLSSEPYPFKQKHIEKLQQITSAKVILVDGEMFSWYGSRLTNFRDYYDNILMSVMS